MSDDTRSGTPRTNDLAGAIGVILEERTFSLCKVLYRHFQLGKATRMRILHDKHGLTKTQSSLGAECPIDQSEERKSVIPETPPDGIDGTKGKRLPTDRHRG
jgi:hypothetical protein